MLSYEKIYRKIIIPIIYIPLIINSQTTSYKDSFYISTWNVENLFDTENDPIKDDSDFLPTSKKQWTDEKLEKKLNNLARVIKFMNNGYGPDILVMQEVENVNVVKRLLYKINIRDYAVIYRESLDERGIDVTIIYDREIFNIINVDTIRVNLSKGRKTRYILYVALIHKNSNEMLHLFANHWPSRRNKESEKDRISAANILRTKLDSLMLIERNANIIILGDFNDEPYNISLRKILKANDFECDSLYNGNGMLFNLAYKSYKYGKGTYLFKKTWNMLDQIIISKSLLDKRGLDYLCDSFEIISPSFMVVKEGKMKGAPLATYIGNKYLGGFSDHFPVGAKFIFFESQF